MNSAVSFVKVGNRYINPQQIATLDRNFFNGNATQMRLSVRDCAGYQETVNISRPVEDVAQKIATSKDPILDLTG